MATGTTKSKLPSIAELRASLSEESLAEVSSTAESKENLADWLHAHSATAKETELHESGEFYIRIGGYGVGFFTGYIELFARELLQIVHHNSHTATKKLGELRHSFQPNTGATKHAVRACFCLQCGSMHSGIYESMFQSICRSCPGMVIPAHITARVRRVQHEIQHLHPTTQAELERIFINLHTKGVPIKWLTN